MVEEEVERQNLQITSQRKKWNVVTSSAFVLKSTRYNVFLSDSFRLIKIREKFKTTQVGGVKSCYGLGKVY